MSLAKTLSQTYDASVVDQAFIVGEEAISTLDIAKSSLAHSMLGFDASKIHHETDNSGLLDVSKSIKESTQSLDEIGQQALGLTQVVEPPYSPELLSSFLEVDETHYRSVQTKVSDSIGRDYALRSILPITAKDESGTFSQEEVDIESSLVESYISRCNDILGFRGVLHRAAMDFEAVGWAALEVIRSRDMRINKLDHIPASRVRVLRGWRGFVEAVGGGKVVYYQNFGEKVVSRRGESSSFYDPAKDGTIPSTHLEWNFIDRNSGETTRDFSKAANEVLWIPKHHSNTIYYGYSDVISSLGSILANVHIRDYLLQFFDHNTIPRYAIIIKGARASPDVLKAITEYFSTHIKGRAHKTLVIPIPTTRGTVEVTFEKLGSDSEEGSFQETRKNNAQAIMTSHGVSPAIIGVQDAANLGSGKGLSQAEIYKDRIIAPLQQYWARVLSRLFRLGLGVTKVVIAFDPLDIRDKEAEMRRYTQYLDRGVLNINQVLKLTGLGNPIPGGDRNFIRLSKGIVFIDELEDLASQLPQRDTGMPDDLTNRGKQRELADNLKIV